MSMSEVKEKKIANHSQFWDKFTFISLVLLIVSGICLTVSIFFQKKYFDYFFVNGQSMYPTLNLHATNSRGVEYKEFGPSVEKGSQHVDYGFYDRHQTAINSVKRFDIIICKYYDEDVSEKIKRVIVMPGETFYIDLSKENYGKLYIQNKNGEFEYVEQPVDCSKGSYAGYGKPTTLQNDEYFVMGDNRNHSTDSRVNGPVKKHNIDGKVVGLVGECEIGYKDSSYYPSKIDYYSPRYF